jgi:hypothetical protein
VDIRSRDPNILCNSFHHREVNFESQLLIIELGSLCSQTISLRYIHESSEALILVCTGTRCTILII